MTTKLLATVVAVGSVMVACGGESKDATPPAAPTASAIPSSAPAPSATPSAAPAASSAAPAASAPPPPPPEPTTKISAFARSASFGKVDKIGNGDGAFKPDGVKDFVFDIELDGAVSAVIITTTDSAGHPNGEFSADTFVGDQTLPRVEGENLNQGKFTGGVAVYENDKLANAKDGQVTLPEGKHKLVLHVSSKDAPKDSAYKAFVVGSDKRVARGPVAAAPPATPAPKK